MTEAASAIIQLKELIRDIEFAMLTTVRPDGMLQSCPMLTSEADADGLLWFLSDTNTDKVEALRTNRRVNVSYADPATERYVSVSGFCQLVRDHEKTRALWKPIYKTWFPKGLDDPDLILLKVHVLEAHYWYAAESRMAKLHGFAPAPAPSGYAPAVEETVRLPEDMNR